MKESLAITLEPPLLNSFLMTKYVTVGDTIGSAQLQRRASARLDTGLIALAAG